MKITDYKKQYSLIKKLLIYSLLTINVAFFGYMTFNIVIEKSKFFLFFKFFNPQALSLLNIKPLSISGVSNSQNQYYFTSKKLKDYVQNILNQENLKFEDVIGKFKLKDNSIINLIADYGVFDNQKKQFVLSKNINITSTVYNIKLENATIDFKSNTIYSSNKVSGKYNSINFNADRFDIINNLTTINLYGSIYMEINEK